MAMSHAFEGHCAETVRYEEMVIDYWKTLEKEEPQNAFYQEGEMANEAARICIDAYDLATQHTPPSAFARPFTRAKLGR